MRQFTIITILISLVWSINGQTNDMDTLVLKLRESLKYDYFQKNQNLNINLPMIYEGEKFNVRIADALLGLSKREIVLINPSNDNTFPLSFSVIFQDNLVSLFEPGCFICYKLSDFTRNTELEKKLNTKQFKYHWLIDNKLYGLASGKFWVLDSSDNWIKTDINLPFDKRPKLFGDSEYFAYCDCHGEFGGTVYFYNRINKNTYFTEATCANSIIKTDKGYYVLSQLGHMMGGTDLKLISDPSKLSNLKDFSKNKVSVNALGYSDKSNQATKVFDFYGIQFFSRFNWNNKALYIVNWQERTFIAEIHNKDIVIVDPLFNSDLYTHNPISSMFDNDIILMNLDLYGIAREREVSVIIIKGKELTKIDWNKKH